MKVILASKSPRRRELLALLGEKMGFDFEIIVSEVNEDVEEGMPPEEAVRVLAQRKGRAVVDSVGADALVISSDTLVELDGVALGKPCDEADAVRMLTSLSDKGHFVRTGVAVHYKGRVYSGTASTEVIFLPLTSEEIQAYVDSGEPMDKAGAYGIQGGAGKFVKEYRGDFDTVVGLSLALTERIVKEALGGDEIE